MRRMTPFSYVLLILLVIGILDRLFAGPNGMIVPLLVFGVIFLLWKYPPNRWSRRSSSGTSWFQTRKPRGAGTSRKERKTKSGRFRVIPGSKGNDGPEEPPKYH
jgi:hypothetical protein